MPTPFESFITGRQEARAATAAKQTGAFRGLQMEKIRSDIKSSIRQAEQTQALSTAQEQYLTGDKAGATKAFAGLGKQGRTALKELGAIDEQQRKARNEQRETSMARDLALLDAAPEEQKPELRQAISARHLDDWANDPDPEEEFSDETANIVMDIATSDPERWRTLANAAAGIEPDIPTGDFVVYEDPNDPSKTMNVNEASAKGQKFLADNPDWVPAPERKETGAPGEFDLGAIEEKELRNYESITRVFLNRGNSLLDLLGEDPNANTLVSALERTGMNIMTNVRQAIEDGGFDSMKDEIEGYDAAAYDAIFEKHGITSARIKGQIIALSYMQAKIFDKGGRITEADFRFAMDTLGGSYGNPKLFKAALEDQLRLADESFRIDYKVRTGKDFEGSLGLRETGAVAPHGERVVQDSITFVWDGNKYVAEQ